MRKKKLNNKQREEEGEERKKKMNSLFSATLWIELTERDSYSISEMLTMRFAILMQL